ncbi:hypothetical protein ACQEUU_06570 [Nonomuraea sp. CA-218870]|uniref:hypothetical protein n=1 Tax=Nonomuraea sp. CA-218870 TaxID=3239998 RepID=UPI003D92E173
MRELAEIFVAHTREDGYAFDWDPACVHALDHYCAAFAAGRAPADVTHSVITGAGAYLGELLVRTRGWRWRYDSGRRAAIVESPDGRRAGCPYDQVAERVRQGDPHDLAAFYASTAGLPAGTAGPNRGRDAGE